MKYYDVIKILRNVIENIMRCDFDETNTKYYKIYDEVKDLIICFKIFIKIAQIQNKWINIYINIFNKKKYFVISNQEKNS